MRKRISVTIDRELLEWLDRKVKEKKFANRSHGIEFLVMKRLGVKRSDKET